MAQGYSPMTENTCSACQGSWPKEDHFIADLGLSKAYLHEDQFFPGWTVVVFKRHATELFHLAPPERIQLIEEVTFIARTLAQVFAAKKINYELLGNQLPHIHWHVIPRLASDPAPLEPVWRVQHEPLLHSGLDLQSIVQRLQQAIQVNPEKSLSRL
jgi:diadenosine tetraphosphate (Ap4A) HIT family hydrolase